MKVCGTVRDYTFAFILLVFLEFMSGGLMDLIFWSHVNTCSFQSNPAIFVVLIGAFLTENLPPILARGNTDAI